MFVLVKVEFDENVDAHGVAMIPILDNVDLVHHIDMYECKPGDESEWQNQNVLRVKGSDAVFGLFAFIISISQQKPINSTMYTVVI